jgi:hypothetical protein
MLRNTSGSPESKHNQRAVIYRACHGMKERECRKRLYIFRNLLRHSRHAAIAAFSGKVIVADNPAMPALVAIGPAPPDAVSCLDGVGRSVTMTNYARMYRFGITPWERYATAAAPSIAGRLDREETWRLRRPA